MACPLASPAGGGWRVAGAEAAGLPDPAESAPPSPPALVHLLLATFSGTDRPPLVKAGGQGPSYLDTEQLGARQPTLSCPVAGRPHL